MFRASIVSSQRASVTGPAGTPIQIESHNRLLALYRGAIGVKTGYTVHARGTFVAAARRGDQTIIVTFLGATPHYYPEAERLLDWGFSVDGQVHPVGELVAPLTNSNPAQEAVRGGVAVVLARGAMSALAGLQFPFAGLGLLVGGARLRVATVARRRRRRG